MSPISGTTAIESPKLKATLSTPPKLPFLGNSAAIKVYPGKKSTNGSPRIIRAMVEGEKAMTTASRMVNIPMSQRSLSRLAFILKFLYLTLTGILKSISHFTSVFNNTPLSSWALLFLSLPLHEIASADFVTLAMTEGGVIAST